MEIRVIFDKPADANPYYSSNESLCRQYELYRRIREQSRCRVLRFVGGQRNPSGHDLVIGMEVEGESALRELSDLAARYGARVES